MTVKHIHILGICGTFMGGVAIIAKQLGYKVTGSDTNVYPPMSTFLQESGIEIIPHFEVSQLQPAPDVVIIGNAMKRGNPCVEYVLENNLPYTSGPQWLHDNLLRERWVFAVSGTHGKTTTTGMLSWILDKCGLKPGFLIGGISGNFGTSARLGESHYFVIEADEYDTAFFDKRSKFVHYNPKTLIINNIGFDHADIFDDLKAIQRQFHHMIRTIPASGCIFSVADEQSVKTTLEMGCWSEQQFLGEDQEWFAKRITNDCTQFSVFHHGEKVAEVHWNVVGQHNMHNALMAIAAAHHAGVDVQEACHALTTFISPKRRLEVKGEVGEVTVYDDFAHHPAEILATLTALRDKVGGGVRILAVLEPRSNTMKMGIHKDEIAPALGRADSVFLFQPENIGWDVVDIANQCVQPVMWNMNLDKLVDAIIEESKPSDHILVMSNGSFGGIHQKLLDKLMLKFE
ncbi:UDP-N-acetylmuramate:L-alanyl-gamma-D-glutamyl-meso-diaminopimelate ligase [Pasteurella canis]|uniref:UDP-N-acetylmuramate--L-alanyl-gamma-D-glutamyl-meso-2,6-diaminoheptandioate ligase n=1 Tax=Pasteurella canis TaxID=753 RepID=A0A379EVJ5_9PAST|nr:UDP-N-acetylmuramate:L-alanyl-gamma-D-glutamyl-meso-diaminopimelate ligase [Pasteurella canis]UAY78665.1 UDP-N-acetylmuramate:L-alanyl-gamma-D-glutamyl-meso-diaminopimelate ligase [Pasteurella canis]SPY32300.1 UDP-N-acetylmuramate:L-alanyl-gamma-D-glutamyl-meso-diaminopimelate ligase [Pasteurella canis]SUC10164.1 UDP-N-acetylmuramate:L-alanyl-gamma-D-glutamyl-meso-diaminopimelate ligase [Pasteurella canis]